MINHVFCCWITALKMPWGFPIWGSEARRQKIIFWLSFLLLYSVCRAYFVRSLIGEMSITGTGQASLDWWKRLCAWHSYQNSHQRRLRNAPQNTRCKRENINTTTVQNLYILPMIWVLLIVLLFRRRFSRRALGIYFLKYYHDPHHCRASPFPNELFALWGICQAKLFSLTVPHSDISAPKLEYSHHCYHHRWHFQHQHQHQHQAQHQHQYQHQHQAPGAAWRGGGVSPPLIRVSPTCASYTRRSRVDHIFG